MRLLCLLALVLAYCACDTPARAPGSAHPLANAGTGSSYPQGTTVMLDGTGSFDPDGAIVAYRWSVVEQPPGSMAKPLDPSAALTSITLDRAGTYWLELEVTDDSQYTDKSLLRIVATGAITSVDAGPDMSATWLGVVRLSGKVGRQPGYTVRHNWNFVSRPPGSVATIHDADRLETTFVADATGTFVVALQARAGDEVREDTVVVEVTATGIPLGTGNIAYTYSKAADRIVYVRDVGNAEVVTVDPMTGSQETLDIGAITPRSISADPSGTWVAVGGLGKVMTVRASPQLTLTGSRDVPGCTAAQVTIPYSTRVDCFPADGAIEPISSVNMTTGEVTQISCPVQFPSVALTGSGWLYMVDRATPQFYRYDAFATPPLPVLSHGSLTGIAPPVIPAGTNQPFAVTGNGLAVNPDATLRFDLGTKVDTGAFSVNRFEIAVVSGSTLKVFYGNGSPVKLTATLPSVNGMPSTAKLVAYSADEYRLIVVANTAAGDIAYTVPR